MKEFKVINQSEVLGKKLNIYGDFENPLILAKDVAEWIGYSKSGNGSYNISQMVSSIDEDEKLVSTMLVAGQNRQIIFLTENGLYEVLMQSRKPIAKEFKKEVKKVLKSIRKHGTYMTPQVIEQTLTNPDFIIQLATTLKEEQAKVKQLETKVETDKPKVIFADAVSVSNTDISVADLAKLIKQNNKDIKIGQNKLFEWLRDNGYLISRKGTDFNSPTQRAMELKLFRVKETAITHSDGHVTINKTSKVTGKGQQYFINKIMKEYNAKNEVNENTNTYVE